MPQPINPLIHIAKDNVNTPSTGLPNKKEPSSILQTIGYDKDQILAGNHFNYILDNLADYIEWLQEQADSINTITLTAGDGLTGGGDLTADRTFAVDSTVVRTPETVVRDNRTLTAGDGLTGGGNLEDNRTVAVDETVVRTPRTINTKPLSSDITLTSTDIKGASTVISQGVINHGGTIPVPSGYTVAQCKFMVSVNDTTNNGWDIDEGITAVHFRFYCSVTSSGVVTAQRTVLSQGTGIITTNLQANYMVIGVK